MTGYDPSKHDKWIDPKEKDFPKYRLCDDCTEKFDSDDLTHVECGFYDLYLCKDCLVIYNLKNKTDEDNEDGEE